MPATVAAFGGKYLVRGGEGQLLEGFEPLGRLVVIEFDRQKQALTWYNSPEYQAILPLKLRSTNTRAACLAGTPD